MQLRKFKGKQLVSFVRQGDFAHAGGTEAIDLVLSKLSKNKTYTILDVGCGLGGTADYIRRQGWGKVSGFDIEKQSIDYATTHYPDVNFYLANVERCDEVLPNQYFDFICLFNAFYAFPNQEKALRALSKLAKPETKLVMFDYTAVDGCPLDSMELPFNPINISTIADTLLNTGWKLDTHYDISHCYKRWYEKLVSNIVSNEQYLIEKFGKKALSTATTTYSNILKAISDKTLGGAIVYAKSV